MLNWSGNFGRLSRRNDAESCVTVCCFIAPAHTSAVAMAAIRECGFELFSQQSYSPDLAPSDYHVFRSLKDSLRGQSFGCDEDWRGHPAIIVDGVNSLAHRWEKRVVKGIILKNCKVNLTIVICVSDFLITYWSTLVYRPIAYSLQVGYIRQQSCKKCLTSKKNTHWYMCTILNTVRGGFIGGVGSRDRAAKSRCLTYSSVRCYRMNLYSACKLASALSTVCAGPRSRGDKNSPADWGSILIVLKNDLAPFRSLIRPVWADCATAKQICAKFINISVRNDHFSTICARGDVMFWILMRRYRAEGPI